MSKSSSDSSLESKSVIANVKKVDSKKDNGLENEIENEATTAIHQIEATADLPDGSTGITVPKSEMEPSNKITNETTTISYQSENETKTISPKDEIKSVIIELQEENENIPDKDNKTELTKKDYVIIDMGEPADKEFNKKDPVELIDIKVEGATSKAIYADKALLANTMSRLIYLDSETPKVQPKKFIWVYSLGPGLTNPENQLPPSGGPVDYSPDRNGFVRLVFLLVVLMLGCTGGFCLMTQYVFVTLVMYYVFACSACSRIPPCNFICLIITTMAYSVIVAAICIRYEGEIVFYAFIISAAVFAVCLMLAFSSFDFTQFLLFVIIISLALCMLFCLLIVLRMFGIYYKPIHILLLIAITLVNCISIVIELQMILGGKTVELGEEDYALGAYMLYTSIISLFLQILQLLNLLDF